MTQHEKERFEQLTERFWNGETTLEEEAWLRDRARYGELPEHLQDLGSYFEALGEESMLGEDFDSEVLAAIDNRKTRVIGLRSWSSIAAVGLALVAGWWFFLRTPDQPIEQAASQEEVQEAWAQTRQALRKVGGELHEARTHAREVVRFERVGIQLNAKEQ